MRDRSAPDMAEAEADNSTAATGGGETNALVGIGEATAWVAAGADASASCGSVGGGAESVLMRVEAKSTRSRGCPKV